MGDITGIGRRALNDQFPQNSLHCLEKANRNLLRGKPERGTPLPPGPRKLLNTFGSESYSKEELIAEMGAAMLAGVTGIEHKTIANSAAYLQSWIEVLKSDSRWVVFAASQAQKAADYIQGVRQ